MPPADETDPQTGLASIVHVLRINVFPLLRLREMQAVLQTFRATRRLLTSGNHKLQSMMRVSLPVETRLALHQCPGRADQWRPRSAVHDLAEL